jgi:transcriptional regulator with XRE-family HTH domain
MLRAVSPPADPPFQSDIMVDQQTTPHAQDGSADARRMTEEMPDDLGAVIGSNLRRLRQRRGYSLETLAKLAGVSRAMVSQIEGGRSMPTIGLLWKIARALEVPFAALTRSGQVETITLLPAEKMKVLASRDGSFTSRALFPYETERQTEFYELTMAPKAIELAEPHAPGTTENLVVVKGRLEITLGNEIRELGPGDAVFFVADQPHQYRNLSDEPALIYLVMTYVQKVTTA